MTFQRPECLSVLDQQMAMFTTPLDALMSQPGRRVPFNTWRRSSACARGYVGQWEINEDGILRLNGFDPEASSVPTLTSTEGPSSGWMALTALPDGAPRPVSFGAITSNIPEGMSLRDESDGLRRWFRHRHSALVIGLLDEDVARWRDRDERLALETSGSFFALLGGRREPSEPPLPWGAAAEVALSFKGFEPIVAPGEVAVDRLRDVMVAHDPIGLAESPLQSRHVSRLLVDGRRENVRGASAYLSDGGGPDRVALGECRWWIAHGEHVPTTADVDPGAAGAIPAVWFSGDLRVVRPAAKRTQLEEIDGRYTKYSWDGSVFDEETIITIQQGRVTGPLPRLSATGDSTA